MTNKFKIHMADDDIRHCQIYETALREELGNIDVEFTHDGKSALDACLKEPHPDLVVLDLDMPKMRGDEVLKELKELATFRDIPVIILTGNTDMAQQMNLLDLGAEDFIAKGASPGIFLARIRAQMRHRLTINRLEQLANDRDMFAAGVLHDIRSIEATLVSLCGSAKEKINAGPLENKDSIYDLMDQLRAHSKKLGLYASEVIHSVRESGKKAKMANFELTSVLEWVLEVLQEKTEGNSVIKWKKTTEFVTLFGDEKFTRLAVMAMIQHSQKLLGEAKGLEIVVSQIEDLDDNNRARITTSIETNCPKIEETDLKCLFNVSEYGSSVEELGMPMVARLMQNMGSRIWAESTSNSGLIFKFEMGKSN
jgi:DNA-binding response OmpR family regulator